MDEKNKELMNNITRGVMNYFSGLLYWIIAIPILCVVALIPTKNKLMANKFHHYFVLEVVRK